MHCVNLPSPRAATAQHILQTLERLGVKNTNESGVKSHLSVDEAYQKTSEVIGQNDRIVIFGSFLTVSAVMAFLKLQKH